MQREGCYQARRFCAILCTELFKCLLGFPVARPTVWGCGLAPARPAGSWALKVDPGGEHATSGRASAGAFEAKMDATADSIHPPPVRCVRSSPAAPGSPTKRVRLAPRRYVDDWQPHKIGTRTIMFAECLMPAISRSRLCWAGYSTGKPPALPAAARVLRVGALRTLPRA